GEEWRPFVPGQSQRTFVFAATDYTAFALLPPLMNRLQHSAPGVRLRLVNAERKLSVEALASGRIDFALGYDEEHERLPEGIQAHDWFADRYVVVARRDHPRLAGAPTLDGYLAERHAVVTPWNEDSGVIDRLLARSGLRREVAVQLPTVLAALFLAGSTDFLLTAPRHAAQALAEAAGLALYPAPFDIPPYVLRLYSHAQHVGRDAHAWMIGQLKGLDISRTG
ncbi:LysR substrate-binding domain-containing protein, partial [Pseudomonas aeruginosa]